MTGRHRTAPITPARRALLGAVPLVGTAGVAAASLLTGMTPGGGGAATTVLPGTTAAAATGSDVTRTLPGKGETAMDAVGGARDAATARQSAGEASQRRVSTVAEELRGQAAERAEQARTAGNAELVDYHQHEAQRQEQAQPTSRAVVVSDDGTGDDVTGDDVTRDAGRTGAADPGAACTSDDLLKLGPLTMSGPASGCGLDPWIEDQLRDGDEMDDD